MSAVNLPAHGGEALALAAELSCGIDEFLDFSSNTHHFATDLTESLAKNLCADVLHYPDPQYRILRSAIAAHEGVGPENILPGNGSAELIRLALLALKPRRVLMLGPMFNEYAAACTALGIEYICHTPSPEYDFRCQAEDLAKLSKLTADLAIICSPNNPGGVAYSKLSQIVEALPAPVVLWDATYKEFLYGLPEFDEHQKILHLAAKHEKLLALCSFTKFFACPGVRLGYAVGSPRLLALLRSVQSAWPVGGHAVALGATLLDNIALYRGRLPTLRTAQSDMITLLEQVKIFKKIVTGVSFICLYIAEHSINLRFRSDMLNNKIIIRSCDNITGMPSGFIRLQVRGLNDVKQLCSIVTELY